MSPKGTPVSSPTQPKPEASTPSSPEKSDEVLVFPTTVGQKRFWSLDAFQPGNPALNMPLAARLEGQINREALQRSLDEILRRHEVLRSRFEMDGEELVQVLCPAVPVELRWIDCTATPLDGVTAKTHEVMLEEGHRSFTLAKGPFLRAALATFSTREHVLMLTMHHAVSDGWSNGIVIREFAENYTRILRGEQPPFGDLELQYADYAVWQRDWLQSPEGIAQKNFWSEQLGEIIPVLNLPTDGVRGRKVSTNGTIASRLLPMDLSESFRQACQQENATPFMGYLAAYVALLRRYSTREEFVVGSPAACRNQTELESMIGLFANPMLIRLRVTPEMTFRQLLQHVRDTTLASVARQEYPFEIIAENLRGEDSRRGVAWLQAYFVYQKAFMQPQRMPDLELTPLRSISAGAVFEWFLGPVERKEGVRLQLEYNTDLFTAATIERAMSQVHALVAQAVRTLDFSIDDLELDDANPFRALSLAPSTEHLEAQKSASPMLQIAAAFGKAPFSPLLISAGAQLRLNDFQENDSRIRQLITSLGADGPFRIGVAAADARFTASSALSICEAGHIAVITTPSGRTSDEPTDTVLSGNFLAPTVSRTSTLPAKEKLPGASLVLRNALRPEATAIMRVSFVSLYRQASAMAATLGLKADDRVLSLASLDTLQGWEELLAALSVGATTLQENSLNSSSDNPSVIFVTSAQFEELLRSDSSRARTLLSHARLLVLDRDPLSPAALKTLEGVAGPNLRILQRHQPQEVGVTVLIHALDTATARPSSPPPEPFAAVISSWNIAVVDSRQVRVPQGLPGRLRVSNASWFSSESSLECSENVRGRPGGSLEWLGQAEDLDRLPGYRLELKQLCEVTCRHESVWNAYAVSIPLENSTAAVVVHVVSLPGARPKATELKAFLAEKLPAYMLPAHLVVHEKIPLTAIARIDYARLRERRWLDVADPVVAAPTTDNGGRSPQGEIEGKLAALFAELLRIRDVDVRQSFFDLGGHSLLGVRLFAQIEKTFQQRLPLATLLVSPSVRLLAKRIQDSRSGPVRWPCLVPMQTAGVGPRFFCVHGAGGNVLLYRDLARRMAPDVRFFGLQAQGLDGHCPRLTSVEAMAELYLQEILAEQPTGPYYVGGYCMGGNIAYEIGQLLLRRGHTVGFVAMLDSYNLRKSLYTGSALDRFRIILQKGSFHLDTLAHLTMNERKAYLAEKLRMATELIQGKGRAPSHDGAQNGQAEASGASLVSIVQKANHVALNAHQPKPFAGNLVLFRPRKNYHTFPDPKMGWGDLVTGRLDIVELPANPHAMLLEPFVRHLAERIKEQMNPIVAAGPDQQIGSDLCRIK